MSGDRVNVNFRFDPALLERIDQACDEFVLSRSRLIEFALEHYLADLRAKGLPR